MSPVYAQKPVKNCESKSLKREIFEKYGYVRFVPNWSIVLSNSIPIITYIPTFSVVLVLTVLGQREVLTKFSLKIDLKFEVSIPKLVSGTIFIENGPFWIFPLFQITRCYELFFDLAWGGECVFSINFIVQVSTICASLVPRFRNYVSRVPLSKSSIAP